jgi:glycosyltransferase involved in cell wall biosynthesis
MSREDAMHAMSRSPSSDRRVAACVPYYRCRSQVRRAVQSLLNQTHGDITVVVVNDADPKPPWDLLADIRDPRLVRFDLRRNHGPYFATAVVLNATSCPFFLIQDADDWSAPNRTAVLLESLGQEGSDLAVSAQPQFTENECGHRLLEVRWVKASHQKAATDRFVVNRALSPTFSYRAPHHGLFRSDSVRRVGGYFGGVRVSYDTLLTNLILMTGRISHVAQPLYYRLVRPESLTHSALTGVGSSHAREAHRSIAATYNRCFTSYEKYVVGAIDSRELGRVIRGNIARNVTAKDRRDLAAESGRLRSLLAAGNGRRMQ